MAKGSKFTNDYKKEIVRLITELGKKPSEVAEDIGVTATTVRRWVKQFSIHGDDAFPGKGNLRGPVLMHWQLGLLSLLWASCCCVFHSFEKPVTNTSRLWTFVIGT